ncbi:hypothetical protein L3V83_08575 [Thiotrichales bacterium 19X7-9]|nr:hypothetical protein [Thiotrichales bacterium 19X7-9]
MKMIKQTQLMIVCLSTFYTNQLMASDQTEFKLKAIQNQIEQLKSQVAQQKSIRPIESDSQSFVKANPVIAKLLSSGGAAYAREQLLLDAIATDNVKNHHLYLGGKLEQVTTYNSDLPNSDGSYNSSTQFSPKAKLGFLTRISPWLSGFFSLEATDGGTSVSAKENYLLFNNAKSPFYVIAGSKYVDFGNFQRFSVSIKPLNRVFWISDDVSQIEGGYYSSNLNVQATIFNGSSKTNTNTDQISNNAETVYYQFKPIAQMTFHLGGAYINAIRRTAKLENSTSVELTDHNRTPAVDIFAGGTIKINAKNSLQYSGEYTQTIQTDNDRNSSAWLVAGIYKTSILSKSYQLFLNYTALNALTGHYNQYLMGVKSKFYGVKVGIDYALLAASEVKNDNIIELKLEYVF